MCGAVTGVTESAKEPPFVAPVMVSTGLDYKIRIVQK